MEVWIRENQILKAFYGSGGTFSWMNDVVFSQIEDMKQNWVEIDSKLGQISV